MTKRINFTETVDADAQAAKDTIDALGTERENGNITDHSVEFRADVGAADDLPAGYDTVDAAINNTPVELPDAASNAPVHNR